MRSEIIAIDIETTGLDPWDSVLTTVAIVGRDVSMVLDGNLKEYAIYDEKTLLQNLFVELENHLSKLKHKSRLLVGWNLTEFDLPFLAVRYVLNGMPELAPTIYATHDIGKYGKPLYGGSWGGVSFFDLAYSDELRKSSPDDVKWSLKPVAESFGFEPIIVDFETISRAFALSISMKDMTSEDRRAYCLSDADLTYKLWSKHELPL